jgi:hypothetical protein
MVEEWNVGTMGKEEYRRQDRKKRNNGMLEWAKKGARA